MIQNFTGTKFQVPYRDSETESKPSKPQEVTNQCLSMVEHRERFYPS